MKNSRAGRTDKGAGPTRSDPWQGRGPEGRGLHVVSILKHKEITGNAENRFMNVIERKENN